MKIKIIPKAVPPEDSGCSRSFIDSRTPASVPLTIFSTERRSSRDAVPSRLSDDRSARPRDEKGAEKDQRTSGEEAPSRIKIVPRAISAPSSRTNEHATESARPMSSHRDTLPDSLRHRHGDTHRAKHARAESPDEGSDKSDALDRLRERLLKRKNEDVSSQAVKRAPEDTSDARSRLISPSRKASRQRQRSSSRERGPQRSHVASREESDRSHRRSSSRDTTAHRRSSVVKEMIVPTVSSSANKISIITKESTKHPVSSSSRSKEHEAPSRRKDSRDALPLRSKEPSKESSRGDVPIKARNEASKKAEGKALLVKERLSSQPVKVAPRAPDLLQPAGSRIQIKERKREEVNALTLADMTQRLLPYRLPLWTEQGIFPQIQIIRTGTVSNTYLNLVHSHFFDFSRDISECNVTLTPYLIESCHHFGLRVAVVLEEQHEAKQCVHVRLYSETGSLEEYNNIALTRAHLLIASIWPLPESQPPSTASAQQLLQQMLSGSSFAQSPDYASVLSSLANVPADSSTPSTPDLLQNAPEELVPQAPSSLFHPCTITPAQSPMRSAKALPTPENEEEEQQRKGDAQASADQFLTQLIDPAGQ